MVEREQKAWGVRLSMQPLTARPSMFMTAEVDFPKGDLSPAIRVWFDGAEVEKPFKLTELAAWQATLTQFIAEVKDTAATLANPANQPKPKTPAKKRKK